MNLQTFASNGEAEDAFAIDGTNRSPILTGYTTTTGIKSGSYLELPLGPMQAIADFRRSNVISSPYHPNYVQPIGNSRISPLIDTDGVITSNSDIGYELMDHGYLANHALYDSFYFSNFATEGNRLPAQAFEQFMDGTGALVTQAFVPHIKEGATVSSLKSELYESDLPKADTYQKAAAYQMVKGPFNVNSTSVEAWKGMLAAAGKDDVMTLWAKNTQLEAYEPNPSETPILPMALVNGGPVDGSIDPDKIDDAQTNEWNGFNNLTDSQLTALANNIVEQVRARGPFLSMSEFVNRRIGPDSASTRKGALETAIVDSGINDDLFTDQIEVAVSDIDDENIYGFKTPLAAEGNPAAGAPGWLNQGDIMRILEPAATVRSDTFVIRVFGRSADSTGSEESVAYAEAVVQRMPDYVDPSDEAHINVVDNAIASPVNRRFGRKFVITSFRWLDINEI
jgi:hypothetical protein